MKEGAIEEIYRRQRKQRAKWHKAYLITNYIKCKCIKHFKI